MNTSDRIHNLELIYEVCCTEMKKLQTTITEFLDESSKTLKVIRSQLELDKDDKGTDVFSLIAYDEYLTTLSTTTEMSRKFNIHLYFQEKQQKFDIESACSQINALSLTSEEEVSEPEVAVQPEPLFLYERASIDHFVVDSVIEACVVYVDRQSLSLNFSICEIGNPLISALINLQVTLNGNCNKFEGIPDPREVFGLVIDNQLFRTVRENTREVREKYLAHLLEFGEVTEIHSLSEMYHLPEKYRNIPAQAVQCVLVSVNGDPNCDLRQALLKYECTKGTFTLARKDDSILYMNLVEGEAAAIVPPKNTGTNPFQTNSYAQEELVDVSSNNIGNNMQGAANIPNKTNGCQAQDDVIPSMSNGYPKGEAMTPHFKSTGYTDEEAAAKTNGLTPSEMDELYREPIQTTNAMKAVMGYDPKDDARICKFYNPVTRGCFKGSNCRMQHTEIIKEGWTKDTEAVLIDVCVPMAYPKEGSTVRVIPTHIVDVCTFYAQMEFSERNDNPLFWSSREIPDKTKLKRPPFLFDMVLAQYTDGNWYRAQVMDSFEDNTFRVFYVDYGNEDVVPLTCLADWNKSLSSYSFQAFRCRIAGIANAIKNKLDEDNALKIIGGMILDQFVSVRVLHSTDEMLVEFVDKNCAKLPDILIWQRFATQVDKIL